jgi:hypothetical protein
LECKLYEFRASKKVAHRLTIHSTHSLLKQDGCKE